jgi:hypothetical protein
VFSAGAAESAFHDQSKHRSRGKASSVARNRSQYRRGGGETCLIEQRKNSQDLPLPTESLAFLKAAVK